jgi:S-DNA-T family DNA segregation ATPase FtsK/SpoIIIE
LRYLVPGRISGALATEKESQIVLGQSKAVDLMGNGDMVFVNLDKDESIRVQAPFVSYDECKKLREELGERDYNEDWVVEDSEIVISDRLLEVAKQIKEDRNGKISTNILQRELKIGYSVAKRLEDELVG